MEDTHLGDSVLDQPTIELKQTEMYATEYDHAEKAPARGEKCTARAKRLEEQNWPTMLRVRLPVDDAAATVASTAFDTNMQQSVTCYE